MRRRAHQRRTSGQALIEFVLVFPIFFFVFCAIFEMGFVMNAWVTLKDIGLDAAAYGSRPDPTLTRSPNEVFWRIKAQLLQARWLNLARDPAFDGSENKVTVDVNAAGTDGTLDTMVRIQFRLRPIIAGGAGFNVGGVVRRIPLFSVDTTAQIENYTKSLDSDHPGETTAAPRVFMNASGDPTPYTTSSMTYTDIMAM